ncbi:MAG: BMP family ABC transporter substrate-binding protein [Mycoplasmoidaceae bacterium]|nr:BMP family ABC transporter substrate-binding protein [Mycoplasmoidaceae bacterium]
MKVDDQHPFGVALDPTTDAQAIINRYNYTAMILDGSTHTNLDRSFNQSLYSGLIDFNRNYSVPYVNSDKEEDPTKNFVAHSYRPAQDNTTEFINIYLSTFDRHYVLGLAGFNHATPLNALMTHKPSSTPGHFEAVASHANATTNKMLNGRGMILIDSNVANNQCVSSAEFRADQGAFLSALSTCMYFYHNLDIYHNKYQNLSVGIMGGVQIPTVNIYLGGFQRGVELFNSIVLTNIVNDGAQVAFNLVPEKADDQYFQSCYNTFMTLLDHSRYGDEIKPLLGDESN